MTSCPSCGTQRVGAERFCPACGLDYWRAAAATNAPAATVELAPAAAVAVPLRGGMSGILVAVGLLLLVGAGVVAAIMVMGGGETDPDLRAGAPAPVYTAEREIVNSFFREARDPDASFAVAMDGTITVTSPVAIEMTVEGSVEMNGSNSAGDMTMAGMPGSEPVEMQFAVVDGIAYIAIPGVQEWTTTPELDQLGVSNPFADISTVSEVEYVGRETSGSTTLHHLLVTKWLGGDQLDATFPGVRVTDKENTFHIWVTGAGVPTRVDYDAQFTGEVEDQVFTMSAEVVYNFSRWGEVAPILPPI